MRHYAGSALMLVATTAVIVGSYTVNLKVSSERSEVENLKRGLVADARQIRDLQAELRTRARLPQMQRWNDEVLQMSAPVAGQYLRSPVQLAGFAVPEAVLDAPVAPASTPAITQAVTPPMVAAPRILPPIVRADWHPEPAAGRIVAVSYQPAEGRRTAPPLVSVPRDLLAQGGQ